MVRKLTEEDWNKLQKGMSRYYIQSVEDGTVKVQFDSEIVVVEPGDEDLLGRVRPEDRPPIAEAKAIIDGVEKIYVFGNPSFSFTRGFIEECKKHGLKPSDVPGSVFEITRTGDWEQEFKYIGRADGKKADTIVDDKTKQTVIDTIEEIKKNSSEILDGGIGKNAFTKMIYIRGKVSTSDTESLLPELEKEGIITVKGDKVFVI